VILRWEAKLQPARPAGHHREDGQRDVTQLGQSFLFDIAEAVGMREQQRARPLGPNGFWRPAPQRPDALDARRMAFISSGETAAPQREPPTPMATTQSKSFGNTLPARPLASGSVSFPG